MTPPEIRAKRDLSDHPLHTHPRWYPLQLPRNREDDTEAWRYEHHSIIHHQMQFFSWFLTSFPLCSIIPFIPLHFYAPTSTFIIFSFSMWLRSSFPAAVRIILKSKDLYSTYGARNYSECFDIHHLICSFQEPYEAGTIMIPFYYRWANWGVERLVNWFKSTQLRDTSKSEVRGASGKMAEE